MMLKTLARRTALALAPLCFVALAAGSAAIDAGKSSVVAVFTQMNVPVEGSFKKFSGNVSFDPTSLVASKAEISIDTASFDIGDEDYNAEVRKKEWLDSTAHPQATFTSTAVKSLGGNQYEATGTLSLKGKSETLTVPFTVKTEGAQRIFAGEVPLSRKTFVIGDKEWDEVLADKVLVRFKLVLP